MAYLRMPLPHVLVWCLLVVSESFSTISLVLGALQMALFALVVCLPLHRTGRMAYVDIGWPWGVALIGVVTFVLGDGHPYRVAAVALVYVFIGARMGVGALTYWLKGWLDEELPRYLYQRIRWREVGVRNEALMAQLEVLTQGLANASFLAIPALVMGANRSASLAPLEVLGLVVWLLGYVVESLADAQKLLFLRRMQARQESRGVCDIGLWRYSRHPNYFGEWLVWLGLVIAAVPSWIALRATESVVIWVALGGALLYVPWLMYWVLNVYSGAVPAEYYSVRKRPDYAAYQRTTNMFFPGPRRG